jgi:hypothetical protein
VSLDLFVTGNAKTFPSAREWAAAVKREGFDVAIDQTFDTRQSSGFRPCPNSACGFEYTFGRLSPDDLEDFEIAPRQKSEILKYDSIVGLHYKTDADLAVVKAAAAVLAKMTGGFVLEPESGAVLNSSQALAWARNELEPQATTCAKTATPKQKLSPSTMAKLALAVAIAGYWLLRWVQG